MIPSPFWLHSDGILGGRDKLERPVVTHCRVTGASQASNRLMTNDVMHGSPRAYSAVTVAQRMVVLDISLSFSGFKMGSRFELEAT